MTTTTPSYSLFRKYVKFIMPMVRMQLTIYLLVAIAIAGIMLLPISGVVKAGLFSIFWFVMSAMYQLAPCVLTRGNDSRIVERTLPVPASLKFCTLTVYFLMITGVVVYLIPEIAIWLNSRIAVLERPEFVEIIRLRNRGSFWLTSSNVIAGISAAATCFYAVNHARRNRMLWGVLSVFAVNVAQGILGAAWGISMAFRAGFEDGYANKPVCADKLGAQLLSDLYQQNGFFCVYTIILCAYTALILWLAYRDMKRRNQ